MGRSRETYSKKEVRNKKEKKRKEKEKRRLARKEQKNKSSLDDMIAYVDEKGNITPDPPDPEKKEEVKLEDIEISTPNKEELDPVRTGKVTFFDEAKGYGFIKDSETQQKIFIHVNNTLEEIHEGNMVNFEIGHGQKGPVALKVKIVEE